MEKYKYINLRNALYLQWEWDLGDLDTDRLVYLLSIYLPLQQQKHDSSLKFNTTKANLEHV